MKQFDTMDGNQAAAHASYLLSEVAAIYPITPSSTMAENVDEWSAHGRTNLFGTPLRVVQMQSEAGAAGAMHGALQGGALACTYTASQGLLLMIPNLYKMVGELLPGVLHVSARAIATHALSIFGDHQDVMACRQTGAILLASSNPQEAMDFGLVSHLTAIKAHLPVIHFFDGFRTSHEIQKISVVTKEDAAQLVDIKEIEKFRANALSPNHPVVRGTAQNPDIYFQGREVQNPYFDAVPGIVQQYLQKLYPLTGRKYHAFDYYGAPDAEDVVIAMGSVCGTIEETVDWLNASGEKVGALKVHLYRPFAESLFLDALPPTVKRVAVLDRTKEPGAPGEPLYLDVVKAFSGVPEPPLVIGGRYGLGSKDTRPSHILAIFANLKSAQPKTPFTIGIEDDVTHLSLPEINEFESPEGTVACKFWGLGSDGTVGANKSAIKIIGNNTDLYVQGYFSYDSKKSGGTTVSHLRFGKNQIKSHYLVEEADYIACHNKSFLYHQNVLRGIKQGGTFVLNCDWNEQELDTHLPGEVKRALAARNVSFYTIDAVGIAAKLGLGNRINMIMQSAFFKLINILPIETAEKLLKDSIVKSYGKKGAKVVEMNFAAVDAGAQALTKIAIPEDWKSAPVYATPDDGEEPEFVRRLQRKMARNEGDYLPTSAFAQMADGTFPLGTTAYEKRGIAVMIPEWQRDKCIECGMCSYICPHATIRLFLADEEELNSAPETFETKPSTFKGAEAMQLRVQVSPYDCTGCGNCADVCPVKEKALIMKPVEEQLGRESQNWEFAMTLRSKEELGDKTSIKGSQLYRPLLEFNGACPGCGETPYVKLLTQLFGDRMMIANATGCSSIWGASAPSMAYSTTAEGKGPSWANSLFEDNAEYGYGMYLAVRHMRDNLARLMEEAIRQGTDERLTNAMSGWLSFREDGEKTKAASKEVRELLQKADYKNSPILKEIAVLSDYLEKRSFWFVGGDGWAYDIGYGGVDHVLASGEDVNIFVMDTEIYSNTGGQSSKATPASAVAKFAATGKKTRKKDLGMMAISYGNVYVAQIAMGANMNQTLKAMTEAERYHGPSLIIAYAPCISHGIKTGMGTSMLHERLAVDAGYWQLYRYNPQLRDEGKNPFQLDSKDPKGSYQDYLKSEVRYSSLALAFPDEAERLFQLSEKYAKERLNVYKKLAGQ